MLAERYLSDGRLHDEQRLMEWTLFDASHPRDRSYQGQGSLLNDSAGWNVKSMDQEYMQIQK